MSMNAVSGTGSFSMAKNLTLIFCKSIFTLTWSSARLRAGHADRHRALHRATRLVVAIMGGVDEKLRFLEQLHGTVRIGGFAFADKFFRFEEVFGELAAGVFVPEELRVVKAFGEFFDDLIFIFGDARVLILHQTLGGANHRCVSGFHRFLYRKSV